MGAADTANDRVAQASVTRATRSPQPAALIDGPNAWKPSRHHQCHFAA